MSRVTPHTWEEGKCMIKAAFHAWGEEAKLINVIPYAWGERRWAIKVTRHIERDVGWLHWIPAFAGMTREAEYEKALYPV